MSIPEEEKHFFKYEYGYINIDSKNLYLTNTGNWSETEGMEEKSPKTINKSDRRRTWILIFLIIGAALIFIFRFMEAVNTNLLLIVLVPFACLPLYKYMRNELGPAFMIPLHKVLFVEREGDGLRIHFTNINYENDSVYLRKIRGQGVDYIENLIASKKIN